MPGGPRAPRFGTLALRCSEYGIDLMFLVIPALYDRLRSVLGTRLQTMYATGLLENTKASRMVAFQLAGALLVYLP
jgi:hypothetical protein